MNDSDKWICLFVPLFLNPVLIRPAAVHPNTALIYSVTFLIVIWLHKLIQTDLMYNTKIDFTLIIHINTIW